MPRSLRWIVSLALIALSLSLLDWPTLFDRLTSLRISVTALVMIIGLAEYPILGYRWHLMSSSAVCLSLAEQLRYYFTAQLFNSISPAKLGGDAYRFIALRPHVSARRELLALIFQERLVGLASYLALFVAGALAFELSNEGAAAGSVVHSCVRLLGLGFALALMLLFFLPRFLGIAERVASYLGIHLAADFRHALRMACSLSSIHSLCAVLVLSVIGVAGWCTMVLVIARDLGVDIHILTTLMICTGVELARLLPLTVQGLGIREGAFALAFSLAGKSPEAGFAIGAVAYLLVSFGDALIGASGWMWSEYKAARLAGTDRI